MSDADCTPGREPRSVAASFVKNILHSYSVVAYPAFFPSWTYSRFGQWRTQSMQQDVYRLDAFPVVHQQSDSTENNSTHEPQSGTITHTRLIIS